MLEEKTEIITHNNDSLDSLKNSEIEVLDDYNESDISKEENNISDKNGEKYVDSILDNKLNSIDAKKNIYGIGKVVSVKDFILEVVGFEDVTFYEKVNIDNKGIGYVIQLKPNKVVIAIKDKNLSNGIYKIICGGEAIG